MRLLVRIIDALLRRLHGVFEFRHDQACILRLQFSRANHAINLPDIQVKKGQPVLLIHLWNEHLPPMPREGATLAWSLTIYRAFIQGLRAVAREMEKPCYQPSIAVGGATSLFAWQHGSGSRRFEKLGFSLMPAHNPLGSFGLFFENVFAYGLIWTFNPNSLRGKELLKLTRTEFWMSASEMKRRFSIEGTQASESM